MNPSATPPASPSQTYPQKNSPPQGNPPQGYPSQTPPQGYLLQTCPPQGCPAQINTGQRTPQGVVVVMAPATASANYGPSQAMTVCQFCGAEVVTNTTYRSGLFTWLLAAGLFLCGCTFGCCLIPFCINDTKDVIHTCPNCQVQISRWNRL
ncbi:hypothetical protein BsWGS_06739 [Bradybaena similaris]